MTGATATRTRALVTGANSGIGREVVLALLGHDVEVVATVRSDHAEAELRAVVEDRAAPARHMTIGRLDVTDAAGAAQVIDEHRPDVVVNNAGHARLGGIMDVDDDAAREQFDSLVLGPARLTRLAVDAMRADGRRGRIVNISSILASTDLPFTGWYSAAKAAFDVVGDALALELRPSGVDVVRIECGAVRTGAWDDAGDDVLEGDDITTAAARRRWVGLTGLVRPLFAGPDAVGEVVARAVTAERPRAVYRVGFASRLGPIAELIPSPVEHAVTAALFGLSRPHPIEGSTGRDRLAPLTQG